MLKKLLEETFDIPFSVKKLPDIYTIHPSNDMDELFEIRVQFRNQVRIIVEIIPQSHAAAMLQDIAMASEEKKALFFNYVDAFKEKGAYTKIWVNDALTDLSVWPTHIKTFRITISKIEEQDYTLDELANEWIPPSVGAILSLLNIESIENEPGFLEGKKHQSLETKYERNPANRELCLSTQGYDCKVCGMNFETVYGMIGRHFIHVHHIEMVSQMDAPQIIDPRKDLIPVCPNCHAMLHTQKPPLLPEQLTQILKEQHYCEHPEK